jgi:hypothetical protein
MHMDCVSHSPCEISNDLDSTKSFVVFEENEILDCNSSDDECDSSDYFRKCYDQ